MKYIPAVNDQRLPTIELTRRNLNALLAKLDGNPPNSLCTLIDPDGNLLVKAVEDAEHYEAEGRSPGAMVPETEVAIQNPRPRMSDIGWGPTDIDYE